MKEDLLHFVWQHQYFDKAGLVTTSGEPINILNPGFPHTDSGPDFAQAKISIGEVEWSGHVEIHVKSSDWGRHGHSADPAYQNVILHVVWEDDLPVHYDDAEAIPTLELKHRIKPTLLRDSSALLRSETRIACEDSIQLVNPLTRISMSERALMSRLELKSKEVMLLLKANGGDWEETTYQWLTRHMGFKKNSEAFFRLTQQLPLKIIRKHRQNLTQLEALLFGVAGFLKTQPEDKYSKRLQKEYAFLGQKYGLESKEMSAVEWKFLRLRPANFPTIRLAQLAQILSSNPNLFSQLIETIDTKVIRGIFKAQQSTYWQSHYQFGKPTDHLIPGLGSASIDILLINVCATILVAYAKSVGNEEYTERALDLLASIKPEQNFITKQWKTLGQPLTSAADSQGLIGLYKLYCQPRQCLRCGIGATILNRH
ncbi:MAG: DUF2851 family protein [Cyclobacteriaceae bacterium]